MPLLLTLLLSPLFPGIVQGDASAPELPPPPPFTVPGDLRAAPGLGGVHQFSSHNREGWNGDGGWHLYDDESGRAVIFDAAGPGCARSLWATDIREGAVLHFFFDGEEEPRLAIPMLAFFRGEHPLFPPPLNSYEARGHWGERPFAGNSFVPIPFAEHLKIAVAGELQFYHAFWQSYPHGTPLATFTGEEDRSFLLGEAFGIERGGGRGEPAFLEPHVLEPGGEACFWRQERGGTLTEIVLEAPATDALIRETWIRMVWDEHDRCDVLAPLGYFFGSAVQVRPTRSALLAVEPLPEGRVRFRCRFPMPFARSARIDLVNRSAARIGPIKGFASSIPSRPLPADHLAYFTTTFREGWTTYGRDWLLAETPGAGWYVGTVQTMLGEHYCEGNEHFALDGAISPQIHGTGTEDYYLGCFWPNRDYQSPFACCVGDVMEEAGSFEGAHGLRACYSRWHLEAPIPFCSRLDARIQHGGYDTIRSSYGSLAFFYLHPRPLLVETDFLDVGTAASEAAHGYSSPASELTAPLAARPEGAEHRIELHDRGRRHAGGEIAFHVAIDPANAGVRLRRRLDQASPRQTAEVTVDGERAGVWYHADRNETLRWFDSDFDLHPRFTAGKERLEVRLAVRSGGGRGPFTDFAYRVYALAAE
ncbi:MAG: DUF2961 domain-containing protein [Planctomycetota bacterium]